VDERVLAERLITYDTSTVDGLRAAAGFIKGWLEAREIDVDDHAFGDRYALTAEVGASEGPLLVFHGHYDVVPARPEQFAPRIQGDRLIGRGAYDMKGGLAAMMCALRDLAEQDRVRVRFMCVPDEESEEIDVRSSDALVREGHGGDFAITGEPTDLHVGIQAKGVLALRIVVHGTSAHGSTPWLGDNAILKAIDVFRRIECMPFTGESSEMFDRPSINLGRLSGGDAPNKVPEECVMDVDIRYLPDQDPGELLAHIRSLPDVHVARSFIWPPARVSPVNPYVAALSEAAARLTDGESMSVGRDGASDAVAFLSAGIPAVEFGPSGGGHHGPDEWVSIESLARYRQALVDFAGSLPDRFAEPAPSGLRAVEGGRS
jgi:succinyl-diaminopimelate desuccinylase